MLEESEQMVQDVDCEHKFLKESKKDVTTYFSMNLYLWDTQNLL